MSSKLMFRIQYNGFRKLQSIIKYSPLNELTHDFMILSTVLCVLYWNHEASSKQFNGWKSYSHHLISGFISFFLAMSLNKQIPGNICKS